MAYTRKNKKYNKNSKKNNKNNKNSKKNSKNTIKGGFRYGNKTKHTPIPGEVLISSPKTKTKTRTRTKTIKQFRFF
jgi:hypothetical protein